MTDHRQRKSEPEQLAAARKLKAALDRNLMPKGFAKINKTLMIYADPSRKHCPYEVARTKFDGKNLVTYLGYSKRERKNPWGVDGFYCYVNIPGYFNKDYISLFLDPASIDDDTLPYLKWVFEESPWRGAMSSYGFWGAVVEPKKIPTGAFWLVALSLRYAKEMPKMVANWTKMVKWGVDPLVAFYAIHHFGNTTIQLSTTSEQGHEPHYGSNHILFSGYKTSFTHFKYKVEECCKEENGQATCNSDRRTGIEGRFIPTGPSVTHYLPLEMKEVKGAWSTSLFYIMPKSAEEFVTLMEKIT